MPRNLTTQDITWFLDLSEKGQLDLVPPYQRRSVWSLRDKRFFIDTILNNYPAPPVFLHKTLDERGRPTYHVVDGKQRLNTILDFVAGQLRIPDDFADVNLRRKKWTELDRSAKERFWNYLLIVEMLPDVSDASVRNIFDRINRNSRKLTPQEMRHAKYDGWFITAVEAESERPEWKSFGLATAARAKRMADVQFVSELYGVLIRGKIEGFDQDSLDELYAEFEDLDENPTFIEEDFVASVERVRGYLSDALRVKSELQDYYKVQAHFYTLWTYAALHKEKLLSPEKFADKYSAFMELVAKSAAGSAEDARATSYSANAKGASTDLSPRQARLDALIAAMGT